MSKDLTVFPSRQPRWRYGDLISHMGGVQMLTRALMARGYAPPGPETLKGWKARNSIPSAWLPAVLAAAVAQGVIRNPEDLLDPGTK